MKSITLLPNTADVRLKIEADSLAELFEAGIALLAVGVLTWMVLWMQRQS